MTGIAHPGKLARHAAYHRARGKTELAHQLEAELVAAGRCRICSRPLIDPVSVSAGIGPDCASKAGRRP